MLSRKLIKGAGQLAPWQSKEHFWKEECYFLLLSKFNYLIHVADQASLNFTWSKILKIDFLLPRLIFNKTVRPPACQKCGRYE